MKEQVIFAGFDGQGVILVGMLLTRAGKIEGKEVGWLPPFETEMKANTVNCQVTLSDKLVNSPVFEHATSLVVMNQPSLEKFVPSLKQKGNLLINSSRIKVITQRYDIEEFRIPADDIASEIGCKSTANMVMLGAYIQISNVLKKRSCMEAIDELLGDRDPKSLPQNKLAFERGLKYAQENKVLLEEE